MACNIILLKTVEEEKNWWRIGWDWFRLVCSLLLVFAEGVVEGVLLLHYWSFKWRARHFLL